ncbi:MAG TPA: condensation domain-containing protein, partial [Thermoanaerobaculia bacterium]
MNDGADDRHRAAGSALAEVDEPGVGAEEVSPGSNAENEEAQVASREERVAGLKSALSDKKRAVLRKLIRGRGTDAAALTVPRRAGSGPAVLSFAQERLWFLDRLHPGTAFYNLPTYLRLDGTLDVAALHRVLGELVARHEALRTVFVQEGGEPVQVIRESFPVRFPVLDLGNLPPAAQDEELQRLVHDEVTAPFDLAAGPLWRAHLYRLGATAWAMVFCAHHIISDGWSIAVLVREVGALYRAHSEGSPSPRPAGSAGHGGSAGLPALPIQYADFAEWQRRWLTGAQLAAQLDYWRDELAGAPTLLALPADRPRAAVQSTRGGEREARLPQALVEQVRSLAERLGATLFMILLAAFDLLLAFYTGQEDVLVGSPVANRNLHEIESLVGFFANTLVLRGRLRGAPTFREFLARVRAAALGAYSHQDLPFEKLVEELKVERSLSYTPLFQVIFVLQNASASLEMPGLTLRSLPTQRWTAKFDLSLTASEEAAGLHLGAEYSADLFDGATMSRLLGHFDALLHEIVGDPERRIDGFALVPAAERQQLLSEWNDTRLTSPDGGDLAARVAAWAARTPAAAAVVRDDESLSYAELDRRANALAFRLRGLGVGLDAIVAICAGRSFAMTVGVLAVLKAGAAYLPLDPAYPPERLSFMLADSGAPVLLVQDEFLGLVPPYGGEVIRLDAALADAGRDEAPAVSVSPENLAYVLFTSGSTGRPKGVAMSRGALA